jgi:mono/diheme cytochrome c family protein
MQKSQARSVRAFKLPVTGLVAALLGACGGGAGTAPTEQHSALLEAFCVDCHNPLDFAGDFAFDYLRLDEVGADQELWEAAIGKLRGRLMPPAGARQPAQADVDALIAYLETAVDSSAEHRRVGHVPVQRLNRSEFAASVKGLIGVDVDPEQILPREIEVEGFDNIANALVASPSFLEQYMSAARLAASRAVGAPVPKFAKVMYPFDRSNQTTHIAGFPLGTRGGMRFTHVFPSDGEYRFSILDIDAGLYPRGMETTATLVLLVDRVEVARIDIGGPEDLELADRDGPEGRAAILAKLSGIPARVETGSREIIATFIDRSWALSNDINGSGRISRVPRIGLGIEVEGPFEPEGLSLSTSREKIFVCQPETDAQERPCAERIASSLAAKAFRRPVTAEDLGWLMPFYETGRAEEGGFDAGVLELVTAILSSPDFLYRAIESSTDEPRLLNDLELATRLAFFLWSQGPDEELIALAADGRLSRPGVIEGQIRRMLADGRAEAVIENFALAWLNLDELEQVEPTQAEFNAAMRRHFETEIRMFLASVLLEGRSVLDLLTADYTFVNDALARQYDVPGVLGSQFRRVRLDDERRWGLLGKGAVLLRTSYGDRTSPVLRGAWILERIFGTPPAPPPPDVVTDLSIQEGEIPTTVRARLENHRTSPNCLGCHGIIDPPGLALENFDVTGRWRDEDAEARAPIDASTELSSGIALNGPIELRNYLTSRRDQFPTTITKRLMMYALNREIEYFDMPQVREIVRAAAEDDYTLASIVTGIVNSDAFRRQGPEESTNERVATIAASDAATGGVR